MLLIEEQISIVKYVDMELLLMLIILLSPTRGVMEPIGMQMNQLSLVTYMKSSDITIELCNLPSINLDSP